MAIEAGLDTLYRAVDILVTEPGDLSARLEQAGTKLLSLNLLPQYEGYPAPFRRGYEELKKGLTAHGDISQTISAAKDDEKKRLAFKIIDLYCSALRRSRGHPRVLFEGRSSNNTAVGCIVYTSSTTATDQSETDKAQP